MVALKRVILHNEKQDGFPLTSLREVRMLKKIAHPNCVRLLVRGMMRTDNGNGLGRWSSMRHLSANSQ